MGEDGRAARAYHGPQLRKERANSWTAAKRQAFLDHLGTSCNVRASAAAAGMSEQGAYALRRRDAGFAAEWETAIQLGYQTVEALLLARLIDGSGGDGGGAARDGDERELPSPQEMDTALALNLLQQHGRSGGRPLKRIGPRPRCATKEELVEALNARIAAVKRHRERRG